MSRPAQPRPPQPWRDPTIPPGFKWCGGCLVAKSISEFYRARRKKAGVQPRCKECNKAKALRYYYANTAKCKARRDEWRKRHEVDRERVRDLAYKRSYGYTLEQYNAQLLKQGGVCPLCLRPPDPTDNRRYALDHDHANGKMRGVLCSACNGGLGCFRDDVALLRRAVTYIKQWRRRHAAAKEPTDA